MAWTPEQLSAAYDSFQSSPPPVIAPVAQSAPRWSPEELSAAYDQHMAQPVAASLGNDNPSDLQRYGRGVVGGLSKLIPFNLGDEIVAGGTAAVDALRGNNNLSDAYNQRLNEVRGYQNAFQQAAPKVDLGVNLGGAMLMPVGGLAGQAVTLPGKAAALAGEGAALGGAYGFGAGQGAQDRLSNAQTGAEIGAVAAPLLGAGLGGASKLVRGAAKLIAPASKADQAIESLGIRASDVKKAGNSAPSTWGEEAPIENVLNTAKANGVFNTGDNAAQWGQNNKKAIADIGDQVTGLLKAADEKIATINSTAGAEGAAATEKVRVGLPTFKKAQNFVDNASEFEQAALQKQLDTNIELLKAKPDRTLAQLNKTKQGITKSAYASSTDSADLNKAIASDLKTHIEQQAEKYLSPGAAAEIKDLNAQQGHHLQLKDIFQRNVDKSIAANFAAPKGASFTDKILGGAGLVGSAASGKVAPLIPYLGAKALQGLESNTGRGMVAGALSGAGKGIDAVSRALSPATIGSALNYRLPTQEYGNRGRQIQGSRPSLAAGAEKNPDTLKQNSISTTGNEKLPSSKNKTLPNKSQENVDRIVQTFAEPALQPVISAIIKQESGGKADAVSRVGAQGLMQLMPAMSRKLGVANPNDPTQNVQGGIKLFKEELGRFKSLPLALAAYNAGSPKINQAIKKAGSRNWNEIEKYLPKETRNYVSRIAESLA